MRCQVHGWIQVLNVKFGKLYDNMAVDWPISVLISMMTMPKVSLHAAQVQKETVYAKGLVKAH